MRATLTAFILLLLLAPTMQAQKRSPLFGLPAGAQVIEIRKLELANGKARSFVLWMLRPKKYPRGNDEFYTCPEETRGSFYRGPTRVSLVDTATSRVVNTVKIVQGYSQGEDEFDIPYLIKAGSYYHVPIVAEGGEGRPSIMHLRDLNGDGRPLEFALFDALACMGLETALFGYSEKQDRMIQYSTNLSVTDTKGKKSTEMLDWVDYLFAKKQTGPGRWKLEIDYRGRNGSLDRYEVRYNPVAERFEGTMTSTTDEQQ